MPVATADELLAYLRQSNLVPPARLNAWLADHIDPTALSPHALADRLVSAGLVTRYQIGLLLLGKPNDTIIAGKYKILDLLGKGGMGAVYLCEHQALKTLVAVKVLPASPEEDPETRARFYREARAFATLNHPNLVRGFDVDTDGSLHFIVMEYVDGVDLQMLVSQIGPLPIGRAVNYARQAAAGLDYAHTQGWIHRDIKPANLAVDRAGVIRVLDMGLARTILEGSDSVTRNFDDGYIRGTADYLAPEQASGSRVDGRCDIYSLGVTMYFLLTGRLPFEEVNTAQKLVAHLIKKPQPIRQLRPELPEGLAHVIETMMAKQLEDRYQTAQEVVDALIPWDGGLFPPSDKEIPRKLEGPALRLGSQLSPGISTVGVASKTPVSTSRMRSRQRGLIIGLGVVGLLAVGLIVFSLRDTPPLRDGANLPSTPSTPSPFLGHYIPVTRAHGPNQVPFPGGHTEYLQGRVYSTIAAALTDPRLRETDNCRILLLDEVYEEQVEIDAAAIPHGISIESARTNPPTQWQPPEHADPTRPLLSITGGSRIAVRNLTFNGFGRIETAVSWTRPGPGCQLHNIRVTRFTRIGIDLRDPVGELADPVQLSRVRIHPESAAPVDTCITVRATTDNPARALRLTECRLEGPAADGLLSIGGIKALEVSRCRLFGLQNGLRLAGPGKLQATFTENTTARVLAPVRVDAIPLFSGEDAHLLMRQNLFFEAASAVRFPDPATGAAELLRGGEGNWCEVGGCPTPTPGLSISRTPGLLIGLDPGRDAEFLKYPATNPLATAGPNGQPVGVPPG